MIYGTGNLNDLPEIVVEAVENLKDVSDRYDFLAVRGMSGVLVGSPLSIALKKPLVVVRKEGESCHGMTNAIGLDEAYDKRGLFVDDFVATGQTRQAVIDRISVYKACLIGEYLYMDSGRYTYDEKTDRSWYRGRLIFYPLPKGYYPEAPIRS